MAKSTAQRVREAEDKRKARGERKTWVWAYPEDRPAIKRYAESLRRLTAMKRSKRNTPR